MAYEVFRLSVPGLFFVLFLAATGLPWIEAMDFPPSSMLATLIGALVTSPSLGYVVTQLASFLYALTGRRPNRTHIDIDTLKSELCKSPLSNPIRQALSCMNAKDVHRLVWVSHADRELRKRSESYWERFYANEGVLLASGLGGVIGLVLTWTRGLTAPSWQGIFLQVAWFLIFFGGLIVDQLLPPAPTRILRRFIHLGCTLLLPMGAMVALLCVAASLEHLLAGSYSVAAMAVLIGLWPVVVVTNWVYLRNAAMLENAWIVFFVGAVEQTPLKFGFGVDATGMSPSSKKPLETEGP